MEMVCMSMVAVNFNRNRSYGQAQWTGGMDMEISQVCL